MSVPGRYGFGFCTAATPIEAIANRMAARDRIVMRWSAFTVFENQHVIDFTRGVLAQVEAASRGDVVLGQFGEIAMCNSHTDGV